MVLAYGSREESSVCVSDARRVRIVLISLELFRLMVLFSRPIEEAPILLVGSKVYRGSVANEISVLFMEFVLLTMISTLRWRPGGAAKCIFT